MQCIIQNMGKTPVNNQYKNSFILDSTYWAVSLIVLSGKTKHLFSFNKNFLWSCDSHWNKRWMKIVFCSVQVFLSVAPWAQASVREQRAGGGLDTESFLPRPCPRAPASHPSLSECVERETRWEEEDPSGGASVETAHLTVQKTAFRQRLGSRDHWTQTQQRRWDHRAQDTTLPPVEYVH